ncbi:hypothetical protein C1H46_034485 [Malus baccata]|uniref:YTH domain-containing family protein n=1 Tax=Malus baccata TaxID=106549 RepID=A0A540L0K2_MALBA|nr:hypothetical protein C1H46_034485 [Malus baccata]
MCITMVWFTGDCDSTKSLSILIMDAEEKPAEPDSMKEQPHVSKNERSVSPNPSPDAATIGLPREAAGQSGPFISGGDHTVFPPNVYAPQAQPFYYRGYENGTGEWDEYSPYINTEGLEINSPGVYNENPSLVFHSGYGYNPQMPYGPYSPVTTPMPSVGGDAQLYSPQQYPFSGPPYYQQLGPPSMQYITSPTTVSQPELTTLVNIDQQGDNMLFGPRPGYHPPVGSFGRGNFPGNPGSHGFHDLQQGFDGFRSGGLLSDWPKPSDRHRSPLSPSVSPQPIGPLGSYGQNVGMASQQQRSMYGFGSGSNSYNRGYMPSGYNQGSGLGSASFSSFGANNRGFLSLENSKRHVKLEQGIEMLNIFKNYETEMSILDDFEFYEDRQKAMQERKARQQASLIAVGVAGENEHKSTVQIPSDYIKHMSKSFAQVVRLDEGSKEANTLSERASPASDGSIGARVKLEDAMPASVPSVQTG